MKFQIFIIFLIFSITSCDKLTIEDKIRDSIKRTLNNKKTLVVDVSKITDFKWDKMYVFKYTATKDEIDNIIGSSDYIYTEFTRRIIFILNDKIVYVDELPTNIEGLVDDEVVFDIPDDSIYKVYSIDNAIFNIDIKQSSNGIYYKLKTAPPETTSPELSK